MNTKAYEVNGDGLVGPTHNYSGLSYGNIASMEHKKQISNPREAALQGLYKMKLLSDLGLKQVVFPPQERPDIYTLYNLGFTGSDEEILHKAYKEAPAIFAACCSASSMWAANSATMTPSADTSDGKVHFTPANLHSMFHRTLEVPTTLSLLQGCFPNPNYFVHHDPLPAHVYFGDEGAGNQQRFCIDYGEPGVHLFVYGRHSGEREQQLPRRFPARQTFEASRALARLHEIPEEETVFAQQLPEALDAGFIHNDMMSVGNKLLFLCHEKAFCNQDQVLQELQEKVLNTCRQELCIISVSEKQLSLEEALITYFFNSQIISLTNGSMALIAPVECRDHPRTHALIDEIIAGPNPIQKALYFNLRQSMRNGGGPACLRLRMVLTREEISASNPNSFLNDALYKSLVDWIHDNYREDLRFEDLIDPQLLIESRQALDELTEILDLGPLYRFQQG